MPAVRRGPAQSTEVQGTIFPNGLPTYTDLDTFYMPESEWRPIDPEGQSFMNLNTSGDLERAERLLASERRG